jgi:hypothetical protein
MRSPGSWRRRSGAETNKCLLSARIHRSNSGCHAPRAGRVTLEGHPGGRRKPGERPRKRPCATMLFRIVRPSSPSVIWSSDGESSDGDRLREHPSRKPGRPPAPVVRGAQPQSQAASHKETTNGGRYKPTNSRDNRCHFQQSFVVAFGGSRPPSLAICKTEIYATTIQGGYGHCLPAALVADALAPIEMRVGALFALPYLLWAEFHHAVVRPACPWQGRLSVIPGFGGALFCTAAPQRQERPVARSGVESLKP